MTKFVVFSLCLFFSVITTLGSATTTQGNQTKLEQLKILKSKLDALNKRNRRLSDTLQKSINYNRRTKKAFNKFKNSGKYKNASQQTQLEEALLKTKDELALSNAQKTSLEKEIRGLLSSDVDIWKVVANKTIILKKIKNELIADSKKQIVLLNRKLTKSKKQITRKKRRLENAKSKILARYLDRDRLLSKIIDDKNVVLTKKITIVQKRIEKILEKENKYLFAKQAKLSVLKKTFQKKKDKAFTKQQDGLTRIDDDFDNNISKWITILDKTDPSLSHNRLTFEHTGKLEALESNYYRKEDEFTKALNLIKTQYKNFVNGEKATFNLMLGSANESVKKVKKQLDDIKSKVIKINQEADKSIAILTENRAIDRDSFRLRKSKLKEKIVEVNYVSDEVLKSSIARLQRLKARLDNLNLEIKVTSIYDKSVYTKKEQLAIVKMQIKALNKTDLSLKSANKSIKEALMDTFKRLQDIEAQQIAIYQKKYQKIDEARERIVKKELKKLKVIKKKYRKVLVLYRKEDTRNNAIIVEKEKHYQEVKLELEDKLKNIKDVFDYEKNRLIENHQVTLSKYDTEIKHNKLTRSKALREKRSLMDLKRLEKRKLIRNFDLFQQRQQKVFVSRKGELESQIEDIEHRFARQVKTLKEKETQLLSEKNQNELDYKNNIKIHQVTRDFALQGVEKVLEDLSSLEDKLIGETTERLIGLEKSQKKSEKEFENSLANLDLAKKSFEKFISAKKNLTKNKLGLTKYTKNIMDSFNLLVEKEHMNQKRKKSKKQKFVTKDRSIRMLENILVKSKDFKPKYELIEGGCFLPDLLDSKATREVCVKDFYISNHEVTNAEYREINPNHYSGKFENQPLNHENQPVARVSWLDALTYTKELSKQTGETYRLPTAAEWEYAARAGTTENIPYPKARDACFYANVADETIKKVHKKWTVHNCLDGFYVSSPVGYYKPNDFGLYDMLGNVWEWTCPKYEKLISGQLSCVGLNSPKSQLKISRGGSWFSSPKSMRFGFKYAKPYDFVDKNVGFRLVREVE